MGFKPTRNLRARVVLFLAGLFLLPVVAIGLCLLLWLSDGAPVAFGAEMPCCEREPVAEAYVTREIIEGDPAPAIAASVIAEAKKVSAPAQWDNPARLAKVRAAILRLRPRVEKQKGAEYIDELTRAISKCSLTHNLDWRLIVALAFVESSFEQYAKGPSIRRFKGPGYCRCCGLMQIHPDHGVDDIFGMASNCEAGCAILSGYSTDRKGSVNIDRGLRRYGTNVTRAKNYWRLLKGEFGS